MENSKGIRVSGRRLGVDKLEDLEITSVGALYHGPWDKKYWSSSRGKDRHPYPVGYCAVRTHMGSTHRMEVREGAKGPLFVVTASDGLSADGLTPDIAWGNYQKKRGSMAKNRNEKKVSSKIDGVELYGFRNPFVLRLLRELMTDMDCVARKDLLSSNISNDTAELDNKIVNQCSHEFTNLLLYLEKQPSTRKRSTRYKTSAKDLDEARRKVRFNYVQVDTKVRAPEQVGTLTEDAIVSPHYVDYQNDGMEKKDLGFFSERCHADDGCCHRLRPGEKSHVEMEDTDEFIEKYIISDNKNNSGGHEYSLAQEMGFQIPDAEDKSELLTIAKDSDEDIPDLEKCSGALVPDTCDTIKHDDECSTSTNCQRNPNNMITNSFSMPEKLLQEDTTVKGLISDSIPEDASTSGCSDPSSQNPDLAVQELTKSMMSFLLPRAVPLVKKTYVKRRSRCRKQGETSRPYSPLAGVGSVEHDMEPKYLASDKVGAGILMQESQSRGHVDVNETRSSGAEYQLNKMVHISVSIGDLTSKPCNEKTGSKGQSSIAPDSFEDDKYMDGVSVKGSLSFSHECGTMPSTEIREKVYTPTPIISEAKISEQSLDSICGDNECKRTSPSKKLDYNEYLLSDSLIACLEEEFNNELASGENASHAVSSYGAKCIDHMAQLEANLVNQGHSSSINTDYIYNDTGEKGFLNHDHFAQDLPYPDPCSNAFEERGICKAVAEKSHDMLGNPERKFESLCHDDPSQFQLHNPLEHENGTSIQIDAAQEAINDKAVITRDRVSTSVFHIPNAVITTEQQMPHSSTARLLHPHSLERNHVPLSESIICRNFEDVNDIEFYLTPRPSELVQNNQDESSKCNVNSLPRNMGFSKSIGVSMNSGNKCQYELHESFQQSSTPFQECNKYVPCQITKQLETSSYLDNKLPIKETFDNRYTYPLHVQLQHKQVSHGVEFATSDNDLEGTMKLVGSYLHPYPILSIFLSSRDDSLRISVMCGSQGSKNRYLFMYSLPAKEQKGICPIFIGHTDVLLPVSTRIFDRNIPFERLGLQLTPDGDSLVILNSIKVPMCRQQKTNCSCSICKSESYEANAIKIVQVKFGYVVPVTKLTANVALCCVLVCEPNYLVALEESGRMHIWLMDCNWSQSMEEFVLPSFDYFIPVELKRIPRSNILIVGHDGIGGFGLWDISKRILVARFSAPGHMITQILPIGHFSLQDKEMITALKEKDQIRETSSVVKNSFLKSSTDQLMAENIAVWLLVSTISNVEADNEPDKCPVRWRLGLLAKNVVTMGSVLDSRISAVDVLTDHYHGVFGTYEGLLYRWELLTGKKLEVLHLDSGSISCSATDAKSGSLAVADGNCRLVLFRLAQTEV